MKQTRRMWMMNVVTGLGAFALTPLSSFAAYEKLTESDAYGKTLGFRLNTEDVDKVKWKRWTAEQHCSNCQLWTANNAEKTYGDCSFFERSTPQSGWCKNYKAKKAAA